MSVVDLGERCEQAARRRARYKLFLESAAWREIRKAAIERAQGRCAKCGKRRKYLHVHHKTYVRFGGQELPEDLAVLCADCHMVLHGRKKAPPQQKRWKRRKKKHIRRQVDAPVVDNRPIDPAYDHVMALHAERERRKNLAVLPGRRRTFGHVFG